MYNLRMTAKTIYYDHDDNNDMKEKYWILPIFGFGGMMMMMMLVVTNVSLQLQYVICKPKRLPFNSCCFLLPFFRPYPYPMYLISFLLFVNDGEARVCSVAEVVYQTLWMATERSLWSAVAVKMRGIRTNAHGARCSQRPAKQKLLTILITNKY